MTKNEKKDRILIVDECCINGDILRKILGEAYCIRFGNRPEPDSLKHQPPSLVFLSADLAENAALDILVYLNRYELNKKIPVILTGIDPPGKMLERAYALGADDLICWPASAAQVRRKTENLLMLYERQQDLEQMMMREMDRRKQNDDTMIRILSHIVETRNGESGEHVKNIRRLTGLLLTQLQRQTDRFGLTPETIDRISTASALHDIGKMMIPEKILNKPGKLTAKEYECMKTHAERGAQMLEQSSPDREDPLVKTAIEIARWHHERIDGSGYPDGLQGDEIPISAQVVALADVYDALTSDRCYHKACSPAMAMQMICRGACGQFSPLLLECLKKTVPSFGGEKITEPLPAL